MMSFRLPKWFIGLVAFGPSLGCKTFLNPPPAQFHPAATRAAKLLEPSASPVRFDLELPAAETVSNLYRLDAGVLIDLMAKEEGGFFARRECGELILVDASTGRVQWGRARVAPCPVRSVLELEGTVVSLDSATQGTVRMTEIDVSTGAVLGETVVSNVKEVAAGERLYVIERPPQGSAQLTAYGRGLEVHFRVPLATKDPDVLLPLERVVAIGGSDAVLLVDPNTGALGGRVEVSGGSVSSLQAAGNGVVITRSLGSKHDGGKAGTEVVVVKSDGEVALRCSGRAVAVGSETVLVVHQAEIELHALSSGEKLWSKKLDGSFSGKPIIVDGAADGLVVVPGNEQLVALSSKTGDVEWSVPVIQGERRNRRFDQLHATEEVVVWDTLSGIVGVDLQSGNVAYTLQVRSFDGAHPEILATRWGSELEPGETPDYWATHRLARDAGLSGSSQLGLASLALMQQIAANNYDAMMNAVRSREIDRFFMGLRYRQLSEESEVITRPIAWNLGRGFLIVRKVDGAFFEVVTGPSDVYEKYFREPSMAAFDDSSGVLVTFSEGLSSQRYTYEPHVLIESVSRRLMGFAVPPKSFHPAAAYAATSKVPAGSYELDAESD